MARAAHREALAVINDIASGLTDRELRARFLASAAVRRIHQAAGAGSAVP